jgi:hypothetical protein
MSYRQMGVTHIRISDGLGQNPCEECQARDGTVVPIDDWIAESLLHPSCTASGSPALEDE